MDSEDLYRPPASEVGGAPAGFAGAGADGITPAIVDTLSRTRPWVLFMGVMVLLLCGLMVLGGLAIMVLGSMFGAAGELGPFGGMFLGAVYLGMALLYLVPGIRLMQFGGAIKRIGGEAPAAAVEQALRHQLAFWRFLGIVTIAVMAAYVFIIFAAVIFGLLGS